MLKKVTATGELRSNLPVFSSSRMRKVTPCILFSSAGANGQSGDRWVVSLSLQPGRPDLFTNAGPGSGLHWQYIWRNMSMTRVSVPVDPGHWPAPCCRLTFMAW